MREVQKMREWFLMLICNHDYREIHRSVYKDHADKSIHLVSTFKCDKCGKIRKEDYR